MYLHCELIIIIVKNTIIIIIMKICKIGGKLRPGESVLPGKAAKQIIYV